MFRLGLTGGIASGKSAVAAMLREMGFPVLDADSLAHKLIEPGQAAHDAVIAEYGTAIADDGGRIDRSKLAGIVFADRGKLDRLNAIIHPLVDTAIFERFDEWQRSGTLDAAFVEAALIIEAGIHKKLDGVVLAWCAPEQQLERLLARGMSGADARRRMAAQLSLEEKRQYASESIDCSGSLAETRRQVEALAAKLRRPAQPPENESNYREGV